MSDTLNAADIKLLKQVKGHIASDPAVVPALLQAISAGLVAWSDKTKRHLDSALDSAVMASLMMPANASAWRTPKHGSAARLAAVGWGLHMREPGSGQERSLVAFVRKADVAHPESAAGHYQTLQAGPGLLQAVPE